MSLNSDDLRRVVDAHDKSVADAGLAIWMGGEPTFTDRMSFAAEWNSAACGDDKHERARLFVARLAKHEPGAAILRTLGRQYPDEKVPRWNYGLYGCRDGQALWQGPPDPMVGGGTCTTAQVQLFRDALAARFGGRCLTVDAPLPERIVVGEIELEPTITPALARSPWHLEETPDAGPVDELAALGVLMLACGLDGEHMRVTLPAFAKVPEFCEALGKVAQAAAEAKLTGLILGGFPPPVDSSIKWTTITPDPGVLEINTAPHPTVAGYAEDTFLMHRLAAEVGLAPQRLYYNGDIVDSGGGGQLTFGGPTPKKSPFFLHPKLLPRLVCYFNRHPCLSYWLGLDAVGGSSQAPRADEGARETFEEMGVAIDVLRSHSDVDPATLWASLAPHLCDRFGNAHRSEINIEKLWNDLLPMRGKLGLVELRALRMAHSPERAVASTVFLRTLLSYLAGHDYDEDIIDWGSELHDRFALPFYLQQDFRAVLSELAAAGFAIDPLLVGELLDDSDIFIGRYSLGDAEICVRRAREFWPLLGDVSQERNTHRLVDPSTARIEVCISASTREAAAHWQLSVDGYHVPMLDEVGDDDMGFCRVTGIRYRAFLPALCLHPLVPAHGPLVLGLQRKGSEKTTLVSLYDWSQSGEAYQGLPEDADQAKRRRAERFVVKADATQSASVPAPARSLSRHACDTRRF